MIKLLRFVVLSMSAGFVLPVSAGWYVEQAITGDSLKTYFDDASRPPAVVPLPPEVYNSTHGTYRNFYWQPSSDLNMLQVYSSTPGKVTGGSSYRRWAYSATKPTDPLYTDLTPPPAFNPDANGDGFDDAVAAALGLDPAATAAQVSANYSGYDFRNRSPYPTDFEVVLVGADGQARYTLDSGHLEPDESAPLKDYGFIPAGTSVQFRYVNGGISGTSGEFYDLPVLTSANATSNPVFYASAAIVGRGLSPVLPTYESGGQFLPAVGSGAVPVVRDNSGTAFQEWTDRAFSPGTGSMPTDGAAIVNNVAAFNVALPPQVDRIVTAINTASAVASAASVANSAAVVAAVQDSKSAIVAAVNASAAAAGPSAQLLLQALQVDAVHDSSTLEPDDPGVIDALEALVVPSVHADVSILNATEFFEAQYADTMNKMTALYESVASAVSLGVGGGGQTWVICPAGALGYVGPPFDIAIDFEMPGLAVGGRGLRAFFAFAWYFLALVYCCGWIKTTAEFCS